MKNTIKKIAILILALVLSTLPLLASCTQTNGDSTDTTTEQKLKIGVIQYGSHPSLDNCYTGIKEGLEASSYAGKYEIDLQNGNFDSSTCDTIAANMAAQKYDMIIAIATPAATAAYSAARDTDIPVIFCAVSDPVAAGLVESFDKCGTNCAGTSDIPDLAAQVELIGALQPDATKIGVLYTTSEANSITQLAMLREVCSERNIEVIAQGVQTAADIPQAAVTLAAQVDCINNFTDNNVVANLSVLLEKATAAGIPVYGSEIEQVKNGCLASISIDYIALGKVTAQIAAKVLAGESAADMPVGQITEGTPVINTDVLNAFGFVVPTGFADAEMVTTTTSEE